VALTGLRLSQCCGCHGSHGLDSLSGVNIYGENEMLTVINENPPLKTITKQKKMD
jgi:hypothetical protein